MDVSRLRLVSLSALFSLTLIAEGISAPTPEINWPVNLGGKIRSSPTFGDIDGDGKDEVVVSNEVSIYALNEDGSYVPGWPQTIPMGFSSLSTSFTSSAGIGDIDNDGEEEIVIGYGVSGICAFNGDGSYVPGWPVTQVGKVDATPALGDINGDGKLEVVVHAWDGKVYAFNGDGSLVPGWPTESSFFSWGEISSPALGDIDGDGKLEIVVGKQGWDTLSGNLYAFNGDGSLVPGWPTLPEVSIVSSPVLGDIDDDGALEVIVSALFNPEGNVYAFNGDGSLVPGWPVMTNHMMPEIIYSSPALGDIDGDGKLEIVVGSGDCWESGRVNAFNGDGSVVVGWWPVEIERGVVSSPALADIDRNGVLDVIVGSCDNKTYAFNGNGSLLSGWPVNTGGEIYSSPALGDIDKDRSLEMIIGSDDFNLYAWDMGIDTYNPYLLVWPMFHHDRYHTGLYGFKIVPSPTINIILNQNTFIPGETMIIKAHVKNGPKCVILDVKTCVELPNGVLIPLIILPSYSLSPNQDVKVKLLTYPFNGKEPKGLYKAVGRFINSINGDYISSDIKDFTFIPSH